MRVLNISSGKSNFIVDDNSVDPEELSREDLLKIMSDIYESTREEIIIPEKTELDEIKNPVEREIVKQIIQKISDFKDNIENIRQEVKTEFPEIEN